MEDKIVALGKNNPVTIGELLEILQIDENAIVSDCAVIPVYKPVNGIPLIERFDYVFSVSLKAK